MNLKDFQNNNKDNPKVAIFPKQSIILKRQRKLDKSMMISITACLLTTNWSMWVTLRREKTSSLSVSGDYNDDVCDDDDNIDNHDGAWLNGKKNYR